MRSTKSEWFSRLRSGAGGKASRQRPPVLSGQAQRRRNGSFTQFTTAFKLWLLSTLPLVQFARSAPESKARPPGNPSVGAAKPPLEQLGSSEAARDSDYQQALLENLKVDTRLKQLQIQALEDEHDLQPLKRREHEVNIQNGENKRDLTLLGVVVIGALIIAQAVIAVADPGALPHSGFDFWEAWKILLS